MRVFSAVLGPLLLLGGVPPIGQAVGHRAAVLARVEGVDIAVPASVSFGSGFVGGTLTKSLGTVEVDDFRGPVNPNTWIVTVTATAFVTGAGGAGRTIANGQVSYWSGPVVKSTGGGTLVPGQATSAQAVTLGVPRRAFSKTSGNGNNKVSWAPTLRIAIPSGVVAGTYVGTVTHSVA
ncbi:hypothetical protein [Micromonospora sp. NPDC001898]|uniref:hypothetical protein n=1 Tax=Micromonospora sp. NPDC001898 TaxID=3364221 RepID=UPI0036BAE29E